VKDLKNTARRTLGGLLRNILSANQRKDSDTQGEQSQDNGRERETQGRKSIQKKEQDQTPGRDGIGHSHFHSPLETSIRLREPFA
jgi:hypothetical protein